MMTPRLDALEQDLQSYRVSRDTWTLLVLAFGIELTASVIDWEVRPGEVVQAWAYNGMVPGPRIDLDVGDEVEVEITNDLPIGTDIHWHGIGDVPLPAPGARHPRSPPFGLGTSGRLAAAGHRSRRLRSPRTCRWCSTTPA